MFWLLQIRFHHVVWLNTRIHTWSHIKSRSIDFTSEESSGLQLNPMLNDPWPYKIRNLDAPANRRWQYYPPFFLTIHRQHTYCRSISYYFSTPLIDGYMWNEYISWSYYTIFNPYTHTQHIIFFFLNRWQSSKTKEKIICFNKNNMLDPPTTSFSSLIFQVIFKLHFKNARLWATSITIIHTENFCELLRRK